MKHLLRSTLLLLLLAGTGCSRCAEIPGYIGCVDPPDEAVLRAAWPADPVGLDPTRYTDDISWRAARMLFEGLLLLTPEGELAPGVAQRWEVGPDARSFTFYLRPQARWSDGTPVTAADFVFAWRRVLDPALGAESAGNLHRLRGATAISEGSADPSTLGVVAESDRVLRVELEGPDPRFPFRVTLPPFFPLPRHLVMQRYASWPGGEAPVGNGPFVLDRWQTRDRLSVRRSETYWNRSEIALEGAVFFPIADGNAVMNLYRSGKLDWTRQGTVPPDQAKVLLAEGASELQVSSIHQTYYLEFNTRRPPTDDPRVRRALELTVPREEIARRIFGGGQHPSRLFVNPRLPGWTPPEPAAGGAAEAQRLLAEAGYPNGEGIGTIEYLYNQGPLHSAVAEYLQGVWARELGVTVRLVVMEFQAQLERASRGDFHISRSGWFADLPDPYDYLKIFRTGDENNATGWSDPVYDDLVSRSQREPDRTRRYEMLAEAEARLLGDAVIIPILHNSGLQLVKPYVTGIRPSPIDVVDWSAVRIDTKWRPPR